jgi:small GTP-binding protein
MEQAGMATVAPSPSISSSAPPPSPSSGADDSHGVSPKPRLHVVTTGDSQVGKSCLIKRYCENKFVSRYIPTIGVDYGVKVVEVAGGGHARANFFDLSGVDAHLEIRNEFYREAHVVRSCIPLRIVSLAA